MSDPKLPAVWCDADSNLGLYKEWKGSKPDRGISSSTEIAAALEKIK